RENIVDPVVVGERILISDYENGTLSLWPTRTEKGWKVTDHWQNPELTQRMASPVSDGRWVYGLSNRKKGQLFVLDPENGEVVWEDQGRGGSNATLNLVGPYLVVTTTEAELKVFKRGDGALEAVTTYEIAPSPVWAQPAWLGDGLLVKDERHLSRLAIADAKQKPAEANPPASAR
ncbi:MAG: PQQ-binding-like beta-propeller repeat protein, partial [Acidobacteriota bacterium]